MADAARATPLPDEEPVEETSQNDDSSAKDLTGEERGKSVAFGTFFSVGPKQYRDVTVIGYDSLRDTVRAVRRSGDSVENVQIPYKDFQTLVETQRQNDLARGTRTKKNSSNAVRGMFGKNVSIDGKQAQVIGYDAQSDEVLVNQGATSRWMKPAEISRPTRSAKAGVAAVASAPTKSSTKIINEQGSEIDEDKTLQVKQAFESGRIKVNDPPGQKTIGLSVDSTGKILRQVEVSGTSIQPSQIQYTSRTGQTIDLDDLDVAIPEITAPLEEIASVVSTATSVSEPSTIRSARQSLQQQRGQVSVSATIQGVAASVAAVAASIPAADTAATAVIASAQKALATYGQNAENRENQVQTLSSQLNDVSNRINQLQQDSRSALAGGNGEQAAQFEQQIPPLQTKRITILDQQTGLQAAGINESNRAQQIAQKVTSFQKNNDGFVPQEQLAALQDLLPSSQPTRTPVTAIAVAAAALPKPPAASPRTFAPSLPTRPTRGASSPSVRTPKPIRPLPSGSLSTLSGQAQRAVEFNAGQEYDRSSGREEVMGEDALQNALNTEGGQESFAGPLDIPEARVQSYAANAEDEPEAADIYGSNEEEGRERMKRINRSSGERVRSSESTESNDSSSPENDLPYESDTSLGPAGPTPQEIARASALQQATASAANAQSQTKQSTTEKVAQAVEGQKKKIATAKKTISNLVDAFDAIHGFEDVVGLLMTFAHLNARLALTVFKKDLPFVPRAGFPYECAVIGCFDLIVVLFALCIIIGPIIIISAIFSVFGGAAFGIAEIFSAL